MSGFLRDTQFLPPIKITSTKNAENISETKWRQMGCWAYYIIAFKHDLIGLLLRIARYTSISV